MDISIIGAGNLAAARTRSGQKPAAGEDSFARHLQQAAGSAPAAPGASAADPASGTGAERSPTEAAPPRAAAASPTADLLQPAPLPDNSVLLPLPAGQPLAAATPDVATEELAARTEQAVDALDEIRRRLALIEQAGQLPTETAAAFAPQPAQAGWPLAGTGPAPTGSPAAATASESVPSLLDRPARASASGGAPLAQPAPPAATTASTAAAGSEQAQPEAFASLAATGDAPASDGQLFGLTAPGAAQAQSTPSAAPGAAASGPAAPVTLGAPLASREWQQDLGLQLIGLHQRGEQQIELHLHPSELGPLSVSLRLGELGAQAQFLSAHPQVRAAVEQAIPQLREALAAQGISLGETSVGAQHQPQGDQQAGSGAGNRQSAGTAAVADGGDEPRVQAAQRALLGQVDLYA
ncbi:Flagellar hook-length control protein fliK [Pseudomonas sp. OF001]|uniref:flagellar hook-length control protein FliK n=1 Tax=Pseudomonas sp. OF001 TaxID=2772300 RepID=UPI001919507B|nr:flagellar hook-length control protein FliK [Pseudomonas sp. OF001]CAD5379331.1 Flagellar hook-length control protein fliK [Pseudomonas sp. OF001]